MSRNSTNKEGQLFLKRSTIFFSLLDYPAIGSLLLFWRSDRESWQLIQFAVQVTSYLSFEEKTVYSTFISNTDSWQLYLETMVTKRGKKGSSAFNQSKKRTVARVYELLHLKQKAAGICLRNFLVISKLAKFLSNWQHRHKTALE